MLETTNELDALKVHLRNLEAKARVRTRLGSAALLVALLAIAAPRAVSQGIAPRPTPTLGSLSAELNALRAELAAERAARTTAISAEASARVAADNTLNTSVSGLQTSVNGLNASVGTLSTTVGGFSARIGTVETSVTGLTTSVSTLETTVGGFDTRIVAVEDKTQYMSVVDGDTFFTNTNVGIRNGVGGTFSANGKGNLIVGYNEGAPTRSFAGSHNLVVGTNNEYTDGAFGCLIAGNGNSASAACNFVSGFENTTTVAYASVFGGLNNTSSGVATTVVGGRDASYGTYYGVLIND